MQWSRVLLALLSLSPASCAPQWHQPVGFVEPVQAPTYVCIDLVDERAIKAAAEATQAWDRSLVTWRHLVPIVEHDPTMCAIVIKEVVHPGPAASDALAWTSTLGGRTITLVRGRHEHDTRGIVLHELGHALGAQHVEGTLMAPRWRKGMLCPDVTTVAQVAAWNHVNLDTLSWCY